MSAEAPTYYQWNERQVLPSAESYTPCARRSLHELELIIREALNEHRAEVSANVLSFNRRIAA